MTPRPNTVNLKRGDRTLALTYNNQDVYELSFELLRVYSPSAEVKGHGPGQEVLQVGKENVLIVGIEAVGNYAIQLFFDDGHDSGIYSWEYLYELCQKKEQYWQDYLARLEAAGESRKNPADLKVVQTFDPSQ